MTYLFEIQLTLHWAQIIVEKVNIVVVTAWFHLHIAAIETQQQMVQADGWKCTNFPILNSVKTFYITKLHLIFFMSFADFFTDSEGHKVQLAVAMKKMIAMVSSHNKKSRISSDSS